MQKSQSTKQFLLKLITQREIILRNKRCRKNLLIMATTADNLKRLLLAYPYNSDLSIALFIQRHRDEIVSIAPGEGATNHKATMAKLQTIFNDTALWHTTALHTPVEEYPL